DNFYLAVNGKHNLVQPTVEMSTTRPGSITFTVPRLAIPELHWKNQFVTDLHAYTNEYPGTGDLATPPSTGMKYQDLTPSCIKVDGATPGNAAAPLKGTPVCNLVSDGVGDATWFGQPQQGGVGGLPTLSVNSDPLDIRSVDVATGPKT